MVSRTVSLIAYRGASTQRAHFAIFIPFAYDQGKGTIIHVVGSPMAGYELEFKRNYSLAHTRQSYTRHTIGQIDTQYIADDPDATVNAPSTTDYTPRSPIEVVASQVRPPRISQNFMAPVNDTTNKRCQEWTMEYLHKLVDRGYIDASAIEIVQSKRDPPTHGIGLQPTGNRGR